ncbi:Uncharacterised protein [Mycobacterium xenopi]|nr:Uncharacterised protein [Mycobacterium xenopi]
MTAIAWSSRPQPWLSLLSFPVHCFQTSLSFREQ